MAERGILIVSFGTSVNETREVTIDAIENTVRREFEDFKVYRAWTSKKIIRKLRERDQVSIMTVSEALQKMLEDGICDVIVQPTHMMGGFENDAMIEEATRFADRFERFRIGKPILDTEEDMKEVIRVIAGSFSGLRSDDALVFMGHGSHHSANEVYAKLQKLFREEGHENFFMGTVEAEPSLEDVISMVKEFKPKKAILTPLMIVAGDHARNDMAGDEEDSWISCFRAEGISSEAVIRGLGEYPGIHQMIVQHIQNVM